MASLFDTLQAGAQRAGIMQQTKQSKNWFRKQVNALGDVSPRKLLKDDALEPSSKEITGNIQSIKVNNQITLGYSKLSGVKIMYKDGMPFKDLNKNGQLDVYEDWRLNVVDRAQDLASKMTIDEISA